MQQGLSSFTMLFEGEVHRRLKLVGFSFAVLAAVGAAVDLYQMNFARRGERQEEDPKA